MFKFTNVASSVSDTFSSVSCVIVNTTPEPEPSAPRSTNCMRNVIIVCAHKSLSCTHLQIPCLYLTLAQSLLEMVIDNDKTIHPVYKLDIFFTASGHTDSLSRYCVVGLPVTAVLSSVVSGFVIALVMCCAGRRRRRRRCTQELAETGPLYDIPLQLSTGGTLDMKVKENVCYGNKHSQHCQSHTCQ